MLIEKTLYHYDDITIAPAAISEVNSRKQLNPYYDLNGKKILPIFASPMAAVVNKENMRCFWENSIIPILPRTYTIEERLEVVKNGEWIALGLEEFVKYFSEENDFFKSITEPTELHVLIDIAQGHMLQTINYIIDARELEKTLDNITLIIMAGNIAEPEYVNEILYRGVDIDYIRLGIGGGACCITSPQTGIHYPPASLVSKSYEIISEFKKTHQNVHKVPLLVADGGIKTYKDIFKALALGADYVMLGTVLSSLYESASDFYCYYDRNNCFEPIVSINTSDNKYALDDDDIKRNYISKGGIYKRNFGMSTPEAQKAIDKTKESRLTEGLVRYIPCINTLKMWTEGLVGYMKSNMSYLGIFNISEIQDEAKCYIMSPNASKAINKSADNHINNQNFFVME